MFLYHFNKVRMGGLEPTRREAPDPKSGMSTNFITSAVNKELNFGMQR
jgi:hypothetical protein